MAVTGSIAVLVRSKGAAASSATGQLDIVTADFVTGTVDIAGNLGGGNDGVATTLLITVSALANGTLANLGSQANPIVLTVVTAATGTFSAQANFSGATNVIANQLRVAVATPSDALLTITGSVTTVMPYSQPGPPGDPGDNGAKGAAGDPADPADPSTDFPGATGPRGLQGQMGDSGGAGVRSGPAPAWWSAVTGPPARVAGMRIRSRNSRSGRGPNAHGHSRRA